MSCGLKSSYNFLSLLLNFFHKFCFLLHRQYWRSPCPRYLRRYHLKKRLPLFQYQYLCPIKPLSKSFYSLYMPDLHYLNPILKPLPIFELLHFFRNRLLWLQFPYEHWVSLWRHPYELLHFRNPLNCFLCLYDEQHLWYSPEHRLLKLKLPTVHLHR